MNFSQDDQGTSHDRKRSGQDCCVCNDKTGIFLTSRHVSWAASSLIVFSFFIFISGYFLGKRKAVEKFYEKVKQESFADQVYYSMCSMYDKADDRQHVEQDHGNLVTETDVALADVDDQNKTMTTESTDVSKELKMVTMESIQANNVIAVDKKDERQFYAELIGFGTYRAAQKFADKLIKNNVTVAVKRRKSKTARGKMIVWYQVVTEPFGDKNDLIALVDDLSARERLKDVRIVSC